MTAAEQIQNAPALLPEITQDQWPAIYEGGDYLTVSRRAMWWPHRSVGARTQARPVNVAKLMAFVNARLMHATETELHVDGVEMGEELQKQMQGAGK